MEVERLTQALADHLAVPIILFGVDLRVAAFSVHDEDVDRDRLTTILSRRATDRARAAIREHRVDQSDGPVHIPPVSGGADRLMFAVRHDGYVVGYVSFIYGGSAADEAYRRADDTLAHDLRDRIGTELGRAAITGSGRDAHTAELLTQLFGAGQEEREQAATRLRDTGRISDAGQFRVATLISTRASRTDELTSVLQRARSALSTNGEAVGAQLHDEAVLVVPGDPDVGVLSAVLSGERSSGVCAGIGDAVTDLASAYASRRRARIALRGAILAPDVHGNLVRWDDLGIDRMLLQLPLEHHTVSDLPPIVQRLLLATSNADLIATVEAYLDSGGDAQLTARRLHVHRSTLYYRLDRARELIDQDLADGRVRRELHTGLRIAALAGLR